MSSSESNSSSAGTPAGPKRGSVLPVVVTMLLLAALVWGLRPARPNLRPAPLRELPADCPKPGVEFMPTNYTDVPGLGLEALSSVQRNHVLWRLNMEPCPCDCKWSIAACLLDHPRCPVSKDVAKKIIADEQASGAR